MPSSEPPLQNQPLGDPALRRSLEDFVRRRVPAADVDDVVQTVLCDALAAEGRPRDPGELRRWLLGIARHKVADLHRRAHREPPAELPDLEALPPPVEARDLLRWADRQAGPTRDAKQTLDWMTREGDGEKLESIAASEQVPAARVRQRVSRMRRWMKERWAAEVGAAAVLLTLILVGWWWLRRPNEDLPEAHPDKPRPSSTFEAPSPLEEARALRDKALDDCARAAWRECVDGLDKARALDPEGDKAPRVGDARRRVEEALRSPQPTDAIPPPFDTSPPPFDEKAPPKDKIAPAPTSAPPAPPGPKFTPTAAPRPTGTPIQKPTTTPFTKKPSPVKSSPFLEGKSKPVTKGGKSSGFEK